MKTPIITIIVPIYQKDMYLKDCLDSILKQTFTNYELILIDDGSADNSPKIIDEFAEKDDRIVVVHQSNHGRSYARNIGIDMAKGDYLTFIDADDYLINNNYLELLYNSLISHNAQISMARIKYSINNAPIIIDKDLNDLDFKIEGKDFFNINLHPKFPIGSINSMLFKKEIFNDIRFPVGYIYEDNIIIHRLVYPCKYIAFNYQAYYCYRYFPKEYDLVLDYKSRYKLFTERYNFYKETNQLNLLEGCYNYHMPELISLFLKVLRAGLIDQLPKEIHIPMDVIIKFRNENPDIDLG